MSSPNEVTILATVKEAEKEKVVAVEQYGKNESEHTAEVALAVRDDYQNQKIGNGGGASSGRKDGKRAINNSEEISCFIFWSALPKYNNKWND